MQVGVVGTGLMGVGIGLGFAGHGATVVFVARDRGRAARAVSEAADELVALGVLDRAAAASVRVVDGVGSLPECELVVESVPEDLAVKQTVFAELSVAQPDAVLGSNTSSLRITDIAAGAVAPGRVVGTHFWYPSPLMPLVELVPGGLTAPSTLDRAAAQLEALGKTPIRLARDVPGFVWNRLVVAVLREGAWLVEQGVVSAADLDLVVERGLARRWSLTGPLASAVLGGAATFETIGRNLAPELSTAQDLDGLSALVSDLVGDRPSLGRWRNAQLARRSDEASTSDPRRAPAT